MAKSSFLRTRGLAVAAGLAMFSALAGCAAPAQKTPIQTATVRRGDLVATVSAAGTVTAHAQVTLNFQTSGRVKEVSVQPGDQVKAGQVLARLDTTDLDLAVAKAQVALDVSHTNLAKTQAGPLATDVAAARASLASAQAAYQVALTKYSLNNDQLTVARAQVDKAAAAVQRAQAAYDWHANDWLDPKPENSQQKQNLDDAKTAYDQAVAAFNQQAANINNTEVTAANAQVAQAQYNLDKLVQGPAASDVALAQAQIKQDQASLDQAKAQLAKAAIVAPFDGTIADVSAQVGQMVGANSQALTLVDMSQVSVAASLAEVDMPKVKVGDAAQVSIDALQGATFDGYVSDMDLLGTSTQGVVNYPATVVFTDTNRQARPGMNASANIIVERRSNVLLVPNRAVRTQGQIRLVTVLYQGQLIDIPVTIGLTGDQESEVLSGLNEGDAVVISGTTTTNRGVPGANLGPLGR